MRYMLCALLLAVTFQNEQQSIVVEARGNVAAVPLIATPKRKLGKSSKSSKSPKNDKTSPQADKFEVGEDGHYPDFTRYHYYNRGGTTEAPDSAMDDETLLGTATTAATTATTSAQTTGATPATTTSTIAAATTSTIAEQTTAMTPTQTTKMAPAQTTSMAAATTTSMILATTTSTIAAATTSTIVVATTSPTIAATSESPSMEQGVQKEEEPEVKNDQVNDPKVEKNLDQLVDDYSDKKMAQGVQEEEEPEVENDKVNNTLSSICSDASDANQEIEVDFTYTMTISTGSESKLEEILKSADEKLYKSAFDGMVDCSTTGRKRTFLRNLEEADSTVLPSAVGFNSAPVDEVTTDTCGDDCYVVSGGTTVLLPSSVRVEEDEVRNSVLSYFKNKMDNNEFNSIHPDVTGMTYRGSTSLPLGVGGEREVIDPPREKDDIGVLNMNGALEEETTVLKSEDGGSSISAGGGAVIAGASVLCLFLAFAVVKKRSAIAQMYYQEQIDEYEADVASDDGKGNGLNRKEKLRVVPRAPPINDPSELPFSPANTVHTWFSQDSDEDDDNRSAVESPAVAVDNNNEVPDAENCSFDSSDCSAGDVEAAESSLKHDVHRCQSSTSTACVQEDQRDKVPNFIPASEQGWDTTSTTMRMAATTNVVKSKVVIWDDVPNAEKARIDSDDDNSVLVRHSERMSAAMSPDAFQSTMPREVHSDTATKNIVESPVKTPDADTTGEFSQIEINNDDDKYVSDRESEHDFVTISLNGSQSAVPGNISRDAVAATNVASSHTDRDNDNSMLDVQSESISAATSTDKHQSTIPERSPSDTATTSVVQNPWDEVIIEEILHPKSDDESSLLAGDSGRLSVTETIERLQIEMLERQPSDVPSRRPSMNSHASSTNVRTRNYETSDTVSL